VAELAADEGPSGDQISSLAARGRRRFRASVRSRSGLTDPVSWLQIEKGWNVVSADGVLVGKVAEVTGDEHDDIFGGLAVKSKHSAHVRYVPAREGCGDL
jgi:hypothetical protein